MSNTVYSILESTIPLGARPLTESETKSLRRELKKEGRKLNGNLFVIRAGADYRGYVYHGKRDGMASANVVVDTI